MMLWLMLQPPLKCKEGSVLVGVFDDNKNFNHPEKMRCAPVESPYKVDDSDCEDKVINDPLEDLVMKKSEAALEGE